MPSIANPYIAGNPVSGEAMLFGRQDVSEFVRANLVERHPKHAPVIHGERRAGKPPILYQMHRHIDPAYLPTLVGIQGIALEGMSGFLGELAYAIRRALRRRITVRRLKQHSYPQDGMVPNGSTLSNGQISHPPGSFPDNAQRCLGREKFVPHPCKRGRAASFIPFTRRVSS